MRRLVLPLLCAVGLLSAGAALSAAPAAAAPALANANAPAAAGAIAATPAQVELGRQIYVEGIGSDGRPVQAYRGEVRLVGREAACIRCHRASGMGSVEGEVRVSPINGRYLYPSEGDVTVAVMDGHVGKSLNQRHPPYTPETFAKALAAGISVTGRSLSTVMPHYALPKAELEAVQAYLGQLSVHYSTGAEEHLVHFATVITPEISAERRKVFRQMIETAIQRKNASTAPQRRYMASAAAFVTRSDRKWALDVWELTGAPDTWPAQLDALYAKAPPFAMLSGLSTQDWTPVHQFCNRHAMPCWFPSVTLPVAHAKDGYNLYFSGGVYLEAQVLADLWMTNPGPAGRQHVQIHDGSVAGRQAAATLQQLLSASGVAVTTREVAPSDSRALGEALAGLGPNDQLAVWWTDGLAALPASSTSPELFLSTSLIGTHLREIPAAQRPRVRLVYPYELPEQREPNLAYLQAWLKINNIPLVDEVMQSEVFFSVNFMTDVMQDMLDNLYRDYLVERAEDMLGRRESGKAEQETRDRVTLGRTARTAVDATAQTQMKMRPVDAPDALTASRLIYSFQASQGTTVYPRLNLGPQQRYASKGAYLAGFAGDSDKLVALHPWVVPVDAGMSEH